VCRWLLPKFLNKWSKLHIVLTSNSFLLWQGVVTAWSLGIKSILSDYKVLSGRFTLHNFCLKLSHATCLQLELYCVSQIHNALPCRRWSRC
jgi:hypothetical protein